MYIHGKLCVPEDLLLKLVYQWQNEVMGQRGAQKMMLDMKGKFAAKNLAETVSS